MNVKLISATVNPSQVCGIAAATCTDSEDMHAALKGALSCGHDSVIEHATFTFKVCGVSRALLCQIIRHRLASFSVQSQRYVDMWDMPVVVPESIRNNEGIMGAYSTLMENIKHFYRIAVECGIPLEDARYATPQAACTDLVVTMNARELHHFFRLRCCNRAQWEIRALADEMLRICKLDAPALFEKAGCACMLGEACPEGKLSCGKPRKQEGVENAAD